MRLLHPRTIEIIASRDDIPKAHISRVWSEIFKWKASGQKHPKMFIKDDFVLGVYLRLVYNLATLKKCNLDKKKIQKFKNDVKKGFIRWDKDIPPSIFAVFDDNYLFSDACSLYYKGINIFPNIFGENWRKYVPVESHKEIIRQCEKTLKNKL